MTETDATIRVLLDAGTGLSGVSRLMAGRPFRGTILLGHLHWDHTQGLPFFRSGDQDGAAVRTVAGAGRWYGRGVALSRHVGG